LAVIEVGEIELAAGVRTAAVTATDCGYLNSGITALH
jgi:hypothetical protein